MITHGDQVKSFNMNDVDFIGIMPGDFVLTDVSSEYLPVTKVYIVGIQVQTKNGDVIPVYNDPEHSWSPPGGLKIFDVKRSAK